MNRYFDIKFLKHLRKNDIHFVYDGFDGDSVITYGTNYFYDLSSFEDQHKNFQVRKIYIHFYIFPKLVGYVNDGHV